MPNGESLSSKRSAQHAVEPSDDAIWAGFLLVAAVLAFSRVVSVVLARAPFGAEPTLALLCALGFGLAAVQATWRAWCSRPARFTGARPPRP